MCSFELSMKKSFITSGPGFPKVNFIQDANLSSLGRDVSMMMGICAANILVQ